jgi:hypothetical protein
MPSAICYEQTAPGRWKEHFCLVNPTERVDEEAKASAAADADLQEAHAARIRTGRESEFAFTLRSRGYVSVEGFRVATG